MSGGNIIPVTSCVMCSIYNTPQRCEFLVYWDRYFLRVIYLNYGTEIVNGCSCAAL